MVNKDEDSDGEQEESGQAADASDESGEGNAREERATGTNESPETGGGIGLKQAVELAKQGRADEIPEQVLTHLRELTSKLDSDVDMSKEAEPDDETESTGELDDRVTDLEETIDELQERLDSHVDTTGEADPISELDDRVTNLEETADELQERLDSNDTPITEGPTAELDERIAEHAEQLTRLQSALEEHESTFEEHRKHAEREREEIRKYSLQEFAMEILRVRDSIENTIEFVDLSEEAQEQLELVNEQFAQVLERSNIEQVDTDGVFDLDRHKILEEVASEDHDADEIVRTEKPGYRLHDRVIRSAEVVIAAPE